MTGLTVTTGTIAKTASPSEVLDCLDPLERLTRHQVMAGDCLLAVAAPINTPLSGIRIDAGSRFTGLITGDPVSDSPFDWQAVFAATVGRVESNFSFADLHGAFSAVIHDRDRHTITVATDSFGFQPVYIMQDSAGFLVSTSIASFLRLTRRTPRVDRRWVQEYLFFNYPVHERTLLENVRRLPAGTITTIDLRAETVRTDDYIGLLDRKPARRTRAEEVEEGCALHHAIVPQWAETGGDIAFSLSGGLDSRAVLASLPEDAAKHVSTFTYGIPGSTEMSEARDVAAAGGFCHRELFLGDMFLADLPSLLRDTVFLSDGQQVINRSNLPLVYGSLAPPDNPVSAILAGVSGDHLFRDHQSAWGNVPYLVSADVAAMHRSGRQRLDSDFYNGLFVGDFSDTEAYLESVLDKTEQTYGNFGDTDAYFRYLMYTAGSRYFGGQASIANQFSSFRTPYWDRRLVQFAMDAGLGTIGLSAGNAPRNSYVETILQASVVARHPKLAGVPYMSLPVSVYARRTRAHYEMHRAIRKARSLVTGQRRIPEEDWSTWYKTVISGELEELLGRSSRVKAYVEESFILTQVAKRDVHWLGKLITVEIALRLAESGWRRDVQREPANDPHALGDSEVASPA